jgi:hypothetical protein
MSSEVSGGVDLVGNHNLQDIFFTSDLYKKNCVISFKYVIMV